VGISCAFAFPFAALGLAVLFPRFPLFLRTIAERCGMNVWL
jgi:hypothetical protein